MHSLMKSVDQNKAHVLHNIIHAQVLKRTADAAAVELHGRLETA